MITLIITPNLIPGGYTTVINTLKEYFKGNDKIELKIINLEKIVKENAKQPHLLNTIILQISKRVYYMQLLFQVLQKKEADNVLCIGFQITLMTVILKLLLGAKYKIIVRLLNPTMFPHKKKYNFLPNLQLKKIKIILLSLFVDKIVVPSNGLAQELRREYDMDFSKIQVIYNGIDYRNSQKFAQVAPQDTCYQQFIKTYTKSALNIVTIGRLTYQKDYKTLLHAISLLRKKIPNVFLYIIGEGTERNYLLDYAQKLSLQNHVHLLGSTKNVYYFLSRADVYVQSSIYEGFNIALVEAMSLKKPIISTDCPYGPSEILDNGKYGILVPVGNAQAISKNVYRLAVDKLAYQKYAALGQVRSKYFSSAKMNKQYQQLFTSL